MLIAAASEVAAAPSEKPRSLAVVSPAEPIWRSATAAWRMTSTPSCGATPGDIRFLQASTFIQSINLMTAASIGIAFPLSILVCADEAID